MIPKAGGPYVFTRRAYGEFGGFVVGYADWFLNTLSVSVFAVAAAEYAAALFPQLDGYVSLTAVAIIVFFVGLHWLGVEAGAGMQSLGEPREGGGVPDPGGGVFRLRRAGRRPASRRPIRARAAAAC